MSDTIRDDIYYRVFNTMDQAVNAIGTGFDRWSAVRARIGFELGHRLQGEFFPIADTVTTMIWHTMVIYCVGRDYGIRNGVYAQDL